MIIASMEFMTAREWTGSKDPRGWFMSEKYDGWLVGWDGANIVCRGGKILKAPKWFTLALPSFRFDAEIWAGYGGFQKVGRLLRSPETTENDWLGVSLRIIGIHDRGLFFRDALGILQNTGFGGFASVITQTECRSETHLQGFLASVLARGGEGVILRHEYSAYEGCKSAGVRKLKPSQDSEGVVVAHAECKRAVTLRTEGGEFSIRADEKPAIGELVTFSHQGFFESGLPREPRFLRIRPRVA